MFKLTSAAVIATSLFAVGCESAVNETTAQQALIECQQDELIARINHSFERDSYETYIALEPDANEEIIGTLEVSIDEQTSLLLEVAPDQDFMYELMANGERELRITFEPHSVETFYARSLNQDIVEHPREELGQALMGDGISWCGDRKLVFEALVHTDYGAVNARFAMWKPTNKWWVWLLIYGTKSLLKSTLCPTFSKCEGRCEHVYDVELGEVKVPGTCQETGWRCACIYD